jgi:hypothetical protein
MKSKDDMQTPRTVIRTMHSHRNIYDVLSDELPPYKADQKELYESLIKIDKNTIKQLAEFLEVKGASLLNADNHKATTVAKDILSLANSLYSFMNPQPLPPTPKSA